MSLRGGSDDWVLEPVGESIHRILDRDTRERLGVAVAGYRSWTVQIGGRSTVAPTRREALDGMAWWLAALTPSGRD